MNGFEKKDFEEVFRLVNAFDTNNPLKKYVDEKYVLYDEPDVDNYILSLENFYKDFAKTSYIKNISIFPAYRNNFILNSNLSLAFKNRVKNFLLNRLKILNPNAVSDSAYRDAINRFAPSETYFFAITKEIYSYLYEDKIFQNEKRKELKKSIFKYMNLAEKINNLIVDSGLSNSRFNLLANNIERQRERLSIEVEKIAIEKNSSLMAEKIFVRNILKLNQELYRRPRLRFIQELMCIPCFKRQLDDTTISRIRKSMQ